MTSAVSSVIANAIAHAECNCIFVSADGVLEISVSSDIFKLSEIDALGFWGLLVGIRMSLDETQVMETKLPEHRMHGCSVQSQCA